MKKTTTITTIVLLLSLVLTGCTASPNKENHTEAGTSQEVPNPPEPPDPKNQKESEWPQEVSETPDSPEPGTLPAYADATRIAYSGKDIGASEIQSIVLQGVSSHEEYGVLVEYMKEHYSFDENKINYMASIDKDRNGATLWGISYRHSGEGQGPGAIMVMDIDPDPPHELRYHYIEEIDENDPYYVNIVYVNEKNNIQQVRVPLGHAQ